MITYPVAMVAGFVAIALEMVAGAQKPDLERYEYTQRAMGTELKIVVYAIDKEQASTAIDQALSELDRLSEPINNYSPQSEVSKLAKAMPKQSIQVSPTLGLLLFEAREWYRDSDQVFDVTAGSLFQLWSQARKNKKIPAADEIAKAKESGGWDKVELEMKNGQVHSISFREPNVNLNVSGLATGFLLDRMIVVFQKNGIKSCLIDAGGDIIVSDPPPGQVGWSIDIAGLDTNAMPVATLRLKNASITTSGDLHQYLENDGVRYSHLIDPRSGNAILGRVSATVIAKRAIDADAGATAVAILGPTKAMQLAPSMAIDELFLSTSSSPGSAPELVHWIRPR
jgi:FAD:protein FMN transferase